MTSPRSTRGAPALLEKLAADIVKARKVTCGEIDRILGSADYGRLNGAICPKLKPIIAHFHPGLDEIYFVPDGWIHIKTWLHAGLIPRGQTCTISC